MEMNSDFTFCQRNQGIQRREGGREEKGREPLLSLVWILKRRRGRMSWFWVLNLSGLWAPQMYNFKGLETPFVGLGCDRWRRESWSLKNLVSKKHIFCMIQKHWKLCIKFDVKSLLCPFGWKLGFLGFKHGRNEYKSWRGQHDLSLEVKIGSFQNRE